MTPEQTSIRMQSDDSPGTFTNVVDSVIFPLCQRLLKWEKDWGVLTVSPDGLLTNLWRIDWDEVEAVWIGSLASGDDALLIRPIRKSSVEWQGSRLARIGFIGSKNLSLAGPLFDVSLDEVVNAMSRVARRPLGVPPDQA